MPAVVGVPSWYAFDGTAAAAGLTARADQDWLCRSRPASSPRVAERVAAGGAWAARRAASKGADCAGPGQTRTGSTRTENADLLPAAGQRGAGRGAQRRAFGGGARQRLQTECGRRPGALSFDQYLNLHWLNLAALSRLRHPHRRCTPRPQPRAPSAPRPLGGTRGGAAERALAGRPEEGAVAGRPGRCDGKTLHRRHHVRI
jgi:hypothetical protein